MVNVKNNFKNAYTDNLWCKTCKLFIETQEHILNCSIIKTHMKNKFASHDIQYENIFGTLDEQENIAKHYTKLLEARQMLFEDSDE